MVTWFYRFLLCGFGGSDDGFLVHETNMLQQPLGGPSTAYLAYSLPIAVFLKGLSWK